MKNLRMNILAVLMTLMSMTTFAQTVDLVCLEITAEGTTSVIALTENILESTQAALAAEGYESTVVECDEEFDVPDFDPIEIPGEIDLPDWGGGDWSDYDVNLVCLEITAEGTTSVIALTANMVEDAQAALNAQGYESAVVECDEEIDLPDFDPTDFPGEIDLADWNDFDWTDFDVNLVCLEITAEGTTSVIALTANILEATQAALTAEGYSSTVVECDGEIDLPGFDLEVPGEFDIPDFGNGDWDDFGDFDVTLVCLEITAEGTTSVISLTENILEATQAALAAQGYSSTVVECEDEGENVIDPTISLNNSVSSLGVYPNPASNNAVVNISFESLNDSNIKLTVHNQLGQLAQYVQLNTTKGRNTVELNAGDLEPGLYIISLTNGEDINVTEKLTITK